MISDTTPFRFASSSSSTEHLLLVRFWMQFHFSRKTGTMIYRTSDTVTPDARSTISRLHSMMTSFLKIADRFGIVCAGALWSSCGSFIVLSLWQPALATPPQSHLPPHQLLF
jgi:hypothetical protein